MTEPHESIARTRKALALAAEVREHVSDHEPGLLAEAVKGLTDECWSALAELAGVRPPSAATKAMVAEMIAHSEAHPVPADPFAGL